ncbi:MAG: hypothetical protein IT245_05115 [Bacteroidia bacterium]|nr:hypothetical protein [Bacteroidia bacterium]
MKDYIDNQLNINYKVLLNNVNKIQELKRKKSQSSWFYRLLVGTTIKNQIIKIQLKQSELVDAFLISTDADFNRMVHENYACLKNTVTFKVYSDGVSLNGTYTKEMKGYLHRNGCCYLETTKTNGLGTLDKYAYPSKMKGQINYLGEIKLVTIEIKRALFSSAPLEFEAQLNNNNMIILESTKTSLELTKSIVIGKMIGELIENATQVEQFFSNAEKLRAIKATFEKSLEEINL